MGTPWYDKDKSASARQQAGKRMQLMNDSAALEADAAKRQTETASPLSQVLNSVPQTQNPTIDTTDNISMLKSMIERPLTPDEVDKRKRAATNVAAVGHLGNMLSAYANLFGTTAGAAPQTLPGYQGPDVQSWEDKIRQKTIEYASIMNGLDRDEFERNMKEAQWANTLDRQKVEDERWNKTFDANQEQRGIENGLRREQFEYGKERDKVNDQYREQQREDALKQQGIENEQKKRSLDISQQNADSTTDRVESLIKEREAKTWRAMGYKPDGTPVTNTVQGADKNMYDINESQLFYKFNSGNNGTKASVMAEQLYKKLPDDIKKEYGLSSWQDLNKNAATTAAAISAAILDSKEFLEEAKRYGLIVKKKNTPEWAGSSDGGYDVFASDSTGVNIFNQ